MNVIEKKDLIEILQDFNAKLEKLIGVQRKTLNTFESILIQEPSTEKK